MATCFEADPGDIPTAETTRYVRELVAELLAISVQEVDDQTSLVSLGLESFVAVRLRRRLSEDFDCDVPLDAFLGDATTADIAKRAVEAQALSEEQPPEAPQTNGGNEMDRMFDLTPLQATYLVGRDATFPLGGVATFYYTEFDRIPGEDPIADVNTLAGAWNQLVERHGMLRAVMVEGQQKILGSVPAYTIDVLDLRGNATDDVSDQLQTVRQQRSHQLRPADTWPLFDIYAVVLSDSRTRICIGFDVLALDLKSWMQILAEWGQLVGGGPELDVVPQTFADIVDSRLRDPEAIRRSEEDERYWRSRRLPAGPALPWTREFGDIRAHRFERHTERLAAEHWEKLQEQARQHGLSITGLLLATFGFTLQRWGADKAFCVNTTLFDRDDPADGSEQSEFADVVGDFTSTVLVEIDEQRTWNGFDNYATSVNRTFWEAMEHRAVVGTSVLDASERSVDPATGLPLPTHPVVFTSGLGLADESYSSWLGTEVYGVSQTPQVLLDHIVRTTNGDLIIDWDYVVDVLPDGHLIGMAAAHTRLLQRLANSPETWADPTLGWKPSLEPEPEQVIGAFGDCGPLLDDPWLSVAAAQPKTTALSGGGVEYSYGDLATLTERNAEALAGRGCGAGDLIGVLAPKGVGQVVAALSILRSGAGYVPIEPGWPAQRVEAVVEQASIQHVLEVGGGGRTESEGWRSSVTCHTVELDGTVQADPSEGTEPVRGAADDLAYVIFTSGSTGTPKGVAVEHRAARITLDDLDQRFPLGKQDNLLGLAAFSFDLSVYDVFSVLGSGGHLVLPDPEGQRDPSHWLEHMAKHDITVWNTAPALLEMLVEYGEIDPEATSAAVAELRLVFLSGDWIPMNLPDRLRRFAPHSQVISLGGATEASIWSICFPIDAVDPEWSSIPYGRALSSQRFYVLDEQGRPCPVGAAGELYIGGDALAREYIGNPSETLARFITNPVLGERLYRTGDLGRWLPDGNIQFLGRVDRQVKIRGHRIELGEIDSTLEQVPGVRQAVASAIQGPDDRPRLVAYVCTMPQSNLDDDVLVDALHERLPAYMVPNHFVWVDQLPITDNGKIDYKALPNPFEQSQLSKTEPSGGREDIDLDLAPEPSTPLSASRGSVEGFAEDIAAAVDTGLELRLVVDRGRLDPIQALTSSASWGERLRSRLQHAGLTVTTQISGDGLIELAIDPAPNGTSPPVDIGPAIDGEETNNHKSDAVVPTSGLGSDVDANGYDPEIEQAIAQVFQELLGGPVDVNTPYFRLGANSLTIVNAHRELVQSVDPELTVVEMFGNPTVQKTATVISTRKHSIRTTQTHQEQPKQPPSSITQPTSRSARLTARAKATRIAQ